MASPARAWGHGRACCERHGACIWLETTSAAALPPPYRPRRPTPAQARSNARAASEVRLE